MVNDKIKLNTLIEIEEEDKKYQCRVLDIDEETISIDIPVCGHEYLFLNKGDKFEVSYLVENECYYTGECTIIKRYRSNMYLYLLTRPRKIKKIQRRSFVRAKTLDTIHYRKEVDPSWREGVMLDLSGGGMRACLKDEFECGENVKIKIREEYEEIIVEGTVVRSEETENIYGVQFNEIDERKRDKLVKKVFTIMIRERKRI
ncbi:MAG: flagellar brake protein [Clostridium sp.]|uniref:flagellar brake protein n=1 Tax=Clostridium sp. TaxID=1506 RepID=UPI003F3827A1